MSRIYDVLKQSENPLVRMIEAEQGDVPVDLDRIETAFPAEPESVELLPIPEPGIAEAPFEAQTLVSEYGYRIVKIRSQASLPVLPFDGSDQRTAECYRILRTNILHHPANPRTIAISSPGSGDGKTTSAINIAGVLALKQDSCVLLVDGDLRRGDIAARLGIEPSPGLAEVLTGQCSLAEAIVQTETLPNLHFLPAGKILTNPTELLDSEAWRGMVHNLREQFQFTVIDSPPIGVVADYDLIQVVSDGTILILRPDHTDRPACKKAIQSVAKAKLLGVLLNCTKNWFLSRTPDDYGYYGKSKQPLVS